MKFIKKMMKYIRIESPILMEGAKSTENVFAKYTNNISSHRKEEGNIYFSLLRKQKNFLAKKIFLRENLRRLFILIQSYFGIL